jgi:hypothetical protein
MTIDTREMDKALAALPLKVSGRIAKQALQAAGDAVLDAVVALCPERTDTPTPGSDALEPGVLRESLTTQVVANKTEAPRVKIGPAEETARVAWWIENGFDHVSGGYRHKVYKNGQDTGRHRGPGKMTQHIPGKHFMAGAFDESIEGAIAVMLDHIGTALGQDDYGVGYGIDENLEGVGADNDHDYGED